MHQALEVRLLHGASLPCCRIQAALTQDPSAVQKAANFAAVSEVTVAARFKCWCIQVVLRFYAGTCKLYVCVLSGGDVAILGQAPSVCAGCSIGSWKPLTC
jgi:hypothetical protein